MGYSTKVPHVSSTISDDAKDFVGKCLAGNAGDRWSVDKLLEHLFSLLANWITTQSEFCSN